MIGNVYDKLGTRNPIARALVRGSTASFDALLAQTGARDVHEVGCGEGNLAAHMCATRTDRARQSCRSRCSPALIVAQI